MKKRILLRLVSLGITSSILLSCGGQLLAAETDEASGWGKATVESAAEEAADYEETIDGLSGEVIIGDQIDLDNDDLAEQYISNKMSFGRQAYYGTYDYEGALTGVNLDLYNYILPHIRAIAAGTETNTYFEIPDDLLGLTYTFAELGLADSERDSDVINAAVNAKLKAEGYDPSAVINALLFGCPYDMYWMDKTVGIRYGNSLGIEVKGGKGSVIVKDLYLAFPVAGEYKGTQDYTVNSQFGQAVSAAVTNAKAIIAENASEDDYIKLLSYADAICDMVEYNYDAAYDNFPYSYGNPWQLIWVFDGDDETTVVCEGYSKAFQYLCDNTEFDDDSIYALSVGGNVVFSGSNSGPHMWNIVHMDDGKNYVVDVTSIDTGDSGTFLKGATTSSASGCVLITSGHKYTYSDDVKEFFEDDELIIASADYEYTAAPVTYKVQLGDVLKNCDPELSKTTAKEGDKITVTVNPVEGYEFDYIEVNGTKVTATEFEMPAEDVVVNVYCKKTDYKITCSAAEHGEVTTNTKTANVGDQITITVIVEIGYELDTLTVKDADGNVIEVKDSKFEMPASAVTVSATFKKIVYSVELGVLSKNCNPKLSVSSASEGDKVTVTVNPVGGYEFDYIEVNGKKINAAEFVMPAENVVVNVYCRKIDYTITCSAATNGTVKTNTDTANVGDIVTVTATPADGYVLDSITVKDAAGNVIEVKDNEFQMPMSNVTVSATFKEKPVVKGWVEDGDSWYYIQDDGTKATGWLKVGAWYYFDKDGVMQTGWQKIDGVWYCFRNSGSMYAAEWLKWGESWYYLKSNGSMATGWEQVGSTWYLFNSNGVMLTGWQKVNGTWYYLESSGAMKIGWLKSGKDWYYMQSNGAMKTGWLQYNNKWYFMDKTSGAMVTGWKTIDGYKYYFLESGAMVTGTMKIDGKRYVFDDNGHCLNP